MTKKYIKSKEVSEQYGLGYKAIRTLVRDRKLGRAKVANAWRYSVDELDCVMSNRKNRRIK